MSELPKVITQLLAEYQEFQRSLPIAGATQCLHDLARFNGNKKTPIHSWFTYKEGFSADLLEWVMDRLALDLSNIGTLLDPFCGAGTSLLSAQMLYKGSEVPEIYGVEHNPFVRFVADAKLSWLRYSPTKIERLLPCIFDSEPKDTKYPVPELSTIRNPSVFSPEVLQELLSFRTRISQYARGTSEEKFLLLGWASVIERVSGVRKDGRALRFTKKADVPTVTNALADQWKAMLKDLRLLQHRIPNATRVKCQVLAGDGRTLASHGLRNKHFDLIVYSPPYLNNIDYSEVYKLELWLSGYVSSSEEFRSLRLGTLRSHPSIKFPETDVVGQLPEELWARRLRRALLEALPNNKDLDWRTRLVKGYMDDMYQALSTQYTIAKPNAFVICVVGNSLHGRKNHPVLIATDLLITALAQAVGFEVKELQIARQLRRRDHENQYLRETIIILRRPE
ncbi:MAG: hypothetical protein WCD37_19550 [Chloroflexia bacterium]